MKELQQIMVVISYYHQVKETGDEVHTKEIYISFIYPQYLEF